MIMTASYEARKFGVHSAMPSRTALGLCRNLTIVPARFDAYQAASKTIMAIFANGAASVEPLSLDEAFLDVSDRVESVPDGRGHAAAMKREIRDATELTVSFGVAPTKLVAKIASDFEKPDGLTVVAESDVPAFLSPLPIRKMWGVGPKTETILNGVGIERIGQLAEAEDDWLIRVLGPWSLRWRLLARGEDVRPVQSSQKSRQISREMTFDRDTKDPEFVKRTIAEMATGLVKSLQSTGPARTVHIKVRFANFETITRQRRAASSMLEAGEVTNHACALLDACWSGMPIRLIGVGLSNFIERPSDQLSLF